MIHGFLVAGVVYISSYFLIFDLDTTLIEGGKRIPYSASRFAEVERVGDLTILHVKKHWTNIVWRPVDMIVRRLRKTV